MRYPIDSRTSHTSPEVEWRVQSLEPRLLGGPEPVSWITREGGRKPSVERIDPHVAVDEHSVGVSDTTLC
jgi:hypothetical protein